MFGTLGPDLKLSSLIDPSGRKATSGIIPIMDPPATRPPKKRGFLAGIPPSLALGAQRLPIGDPDRL